MKSEPERIPGRPQGERSRKAERECGRRSRNRPAAGEANAEARAKERQDAARSREELTEGQSVSIKASVNVRIASEDFCIVFKNREGITNGGLAQLEERVLCKHEVTGSSPVFSTIWADSSVG